MTQFFILAALMTAICAIATFRGIEHPPFDTLKLIGAFWVFYSIAMVTV